MQIIFKHTSRVENHNEWISSWFPNQEFPKTTFGWSKTILLRKKTRRERSVRISGAYNWQAARYIQASRKKYFRWYIVCASGRGGSTFASVIPVCTQTSDRLSYPFCSFFWPFVPWQSGEWRGLSALQEIYRVSFASQSGHEPVTEPLDLPS